MQGVKKTLLTIVIISMTASIYAMIVIGSLDMEYGLTNPLTPALGMAIKGPKEKKMVKLILNCNRCDKEFEHSNKLRLCNWEPNYHRGIDRIPMNFSIPCPYCGMFDSHYVFEKNNT